MVMVTRRPIATHPAFAWLIALWSAALLGSVVAVLPARALANALAGLSLDSLLPLTWVGRVSVVVLAALIGALAGFAAARRIARHFGADPRPIYAEAEAEPEPAEADPPRRRPLHVREELADGLGDDSQVAAPPSRRSDPARIVDAEFMILTPQPTHPPATDAGLEGLLEQFDAAFTAFRNDEADRAAFGDLPPGGDAVQEFVARQTGTAPPAPASSRIGGAGPDHQAQLRAVLDTLARSKDTV